MSASKLLFAMKKAVPMALASVYLFKNEFTMNNNSDLLEVLEANEFVNLKKAIEVDKK